MDERKIELLSPAGSFECLQAAINGGADAIYFGVEQLNMRAKSVNTFALTDIKAIAETCKKTGIRSYITLNTVMYDHDIQLLQRILKLVKRYKIDAVIASDFSVIAYCNELNIPLHISTQANVSNIAAVQFFSKYADVVVLARELTLRQVEQISKDIRRKNIRGISGDLMKIELFVHGAMCMAISGKCYLSLHAQNASANRGACTQTCRRRYRVTDIETNESLEIDNEYIMSPKDLCTIGTLDLLIKSGVDVLKIEGRSKGADYVFTVTKCYREAVQAINCNEFTTAKINDWMSRLSTVYNRGFWGGYYLGHKMGEWTSQPGSAATERKIYIGRGSKYYPRIKVGEFTIESGSIKAGDTLMITGTDFGVLKEKLETLTVNGEQHEVAVKGDKITLPFTSKVTSSAKLYKIVQSGHE